MIEQTLLLDFVILAVCAYLLLRHGRVGYSHPAVIYFIFHIFVVTWRLFTITQGSPLLFQGERWPGFLQPITEQEIVRAARMADLALVVITTGCVHAVWDDRRRLQSQPERKSAGVRSLSKQNILIIAIPSFFIGLLGLYIGAPYLPLERTMVDLGHWEKSSWISITQFWPVLAVLALIYWYGFRKPLTGLAAILITLLAFQGAKRFRVVSSLVVIFQIYMDRKRLKWPPLVSIIIILVVGLLFFPLKSIGTMVQRGAPRERLFEEVVISIEDISIGQADAQLLDQFAGYVTGIDTNGRLYYGSIYLPLLTLPIPRQIWPSKPGVADFTDDWSSPSRPFSTFGMTMLSWGEAYANFGYFGIVINFHILGYGLSRFYFAAYRKPYYSLLRFGYVLFVANLPQIYRDGLRAIVVFVVMNMLPLTAILILHIFRPSDEVLAQRLASGQLIPFIRDSRRWQHIRELAFPPEQRDA